MRMVVAHDVHLGIGMQRSAARGENLLRNEQSGSQCRGDADADGGGAQRYCTTRCRERAPHERPAGGLLSPARASTSGALRHCEKHTLERSASTQLIAVRSQRCGVVPE